MLATFTSVSPTKWAYIAKPWNELYHLNCKLQFPVKAIKTKWFKFVICSLKRKNRKHLPTALASLIREFRTLYGNEKIEGISNNPGVSKKKKKTTNEVAEMASTIS